MRENYRKTVCRCIAYSFVILMLFNSTSWAGNCSLVLKNFSNKNSFDFQKENWLFDWSEVYQRIETEWQLKMNLKDSNQKLNTGSWNSFKWRLAMRAQGIPKKERTPKSEFPDKIFLHELFHAGNSVDFIENDEASIYHSYFSLGDNPYTNFASLLGQLSSAILSYQRFISFDEVRAYYGEADFLFWMADLMKKDPKFTSDEIKAVRSQAEMAHKVSREFLKANDQLLEATSRYLESREPFKKNELRAIRHPEYPAWYIVKFKVPFYDTELNFSVTISPDGLSTIDQAIRSEFERLYAEHLAWKKTFGGWSRIHLIKLNIQESPETYGLSPNFTLNEIDVDGLLRMIPEITKNYHPTVQKENSGWFSSLFKF